MRLRCVTGRMVMSGAISWRSAAVSAQVAALIVALGCDSASRTLPTGPSIPAPRPVGAIGGTVTINGEARPVGGGELQQATGGFPRAFGRALPTRGEGW